MATDTVEAAVQNLGTLRESVRTGERLAQDVCMDTIDEEVVGLSNLRTGASMVQVNVENLESKVKAGVIAMTGQFSAASGRVSTSESAVQDINNVMGVIYVRLAALEQIVQQMGGAGHSQLLSRLNLLCWRHKQVNTVALNLELNNGSSHY